MVKEIMEKARNRDWGAQKAMGTILAKRYNEGMVKEIMEKARNGSEGAKKAMGTILAEHYNEGMVQEIMQMARDNSVVAQKVMGTILAKRYNEGMVQEIMQMARDGSVGAQRAMGTILAKRYNEGMVQEIMQMARDGSVGAQKAMGTIIKIRSKQQIDNDMRACEARSTERVRSGEGSSSQGGQLLDQMKRILEEHSQMEKRENKRKQEAEQRLQRELRALEERIRREEQQKLHRELEAQEERIRREEQQKLQQERDRFQRQLRDAHQERNQAQQERDQARGQLRDAREERDQARNDLREAEQAREQVLAREKQVEDREKKVKIREGKADRRNENKESARRKSRFMDGLENNIEEILRESTPENDCLRKVRDLYRNRMNPALNLGMTREQFAQEFRDCVEQIAGDCDAPEGLHLKFPKNIETITKLVKNLDEIFQRYDHEEVLLIQVRELHTNTLRNSATSGMSRQELAQELRYCVEKLMNDRDVLESTRARVMQYDR
jgi:DNA repair exonuclease SbcCD ATPase subunit